MAEDEGKDEETPPPPPPTPRQHMGRRGSVLRRNDERKDHLHKLFLKEKIRSKRFMSMIVPDAIDDADLEAPPTLSLSTGDVVDSQYLKELQVEVENEEKEDETSSKLDEMNNILKKNNLDLADMKRRPLEVRMEDYGYTACVNASSAEIKTVYNSSMLYPIVQFFKRLRHKEPLFPNNETEKPILQNINLVVEPGKAYLVLGPPGAGKSTLLKSIAGLLRPAKKDTVLGSISYNGRSLEDKKEFHIENAFAYIDQLDKHAPRFTVGNTFGFAYNCKKPESATKGGPIKMKEQIELELVMTALGLTDVKDTYVGDTNVRGVSGGQRRRVTVGEMLMSRSSVLCGDEISTGLDASSTFDMVQILIYYAKFGQLSRVISLLQPSPETVALFDEVIVMAEGQIVYAGPVKSVENYFADIGYVCPKFMDVADFLQMVTTEDSASLYDPTKSILAREGQQKTTSTAPTVSELAAMFRESDIGKKIKENLKLPQTYVWSKDDKTAIDSSRLSPISESRNVQRKYQNNFFVSTWLNFVRFLILWSRDTRPIIAAAVKNIIMGISVGGCYFSTENVIQIEGAMFQAILFIILGSLQAAPALVTDRIVYYKHTDANFYSAWPFVFGRTMSQLPQITCDTIVFATLLYYMVGLADRVDAVNFFVYLSLLWVFAILMSQQLSVFASFAGEGTLSALGSCLVLFLILFCGFIISPETIPNYYVWLYWWNPAAWTYRALVVNEFRSGRWPINPDGPNPDEILENSGMVDPYGDSFGQEWVRYAYAYGIPYSLFCTVLTALGLTFIRNDQSGTAVGEPEKADGPADIVKEEEPEKAIDIPFKPVNLSFEDICYDVIASTSKETLRLLKSVNGIFRAGRMCALMGSSGAGKTTLMDVIALRKRSGTISGKVLLNGWPQEKISFTRASGYVEQFDVQSPQLTVRETILFSARLRIDPNLVPDDDDIQAFVDRVMEDTELTDLRDSPVGTDEGLGLSFEQKKRLSIAVEMAASPSLLFLDEPTSGLDARSAMLVVKTLRKIADGGRTVCATIHQPSSSVFELFDDLLLLKKGGQVVFHGELGKDSQNLVKYLESKGGEPIELGDNPANWMLRVLDSSGVGDLAEKYIESEEYSSLKKELEGIESSPEEGAKIEYYSEFAASRWTRQKMINRRLTTIYWRSPSYNYSRILVSILISFVLASSFITKRHPDFFTENDMRSRINVIFLTFIITGIMAILTVVPVMTSIRDMFYRQRDAGMYDSASIGLALGVAEKWFIVGSSVVFMLIFLSTAGLVSPNDVPLRKFARCVGFWGFFTFNFALYSYFGQLFVCLVKPAATALILCSVFIGLNNFFSGLVVRPQFMIGTFYVVPFYITPGQYVYNGLITSIYHNNTDKVLADSGSEFSEYLGCNTTTTTTTTHCYGTAYDYVQSFFGGVYGNVETQLTNILVLGLFLVVARLFTWFALKYIRFSD